MRELTDSERVALEAAWQIELKNELGSWNKVEKAFTAGLEYQDALIAELEAKLAAYRAFVTDKITVDELRKGVD